jgi:hypothetical protein
VRLVAPLVARDVRAIFAHRRRALLSQFERGPGG